ncbi:hypothetical protein ACPPVV_11860 [Rhodanobacter sp. Col0626]|uniref:hypothetical protein n=1 Tax=Rhodanobacter sp. Col0626 TaxID=3415679 RepID=UPI003CEB0E3D
MTIRSKGPLAGFGWLTRGFSVGFRHPKPLLGGAGILVLACLLPSLITLPMQFHTMLAGTQPNPTTMVWIMAISFVFGLLILPLYAGYLQMMDAAERGLPVRARDVFNPYRRGEAWRLIGYGLAMFVVYAVAMGLVVVATGSGIVTWYMQALAAQTSHLPPPALPHGFGIIITLLLLMAVFIMGLYAISLGQVALSRRSVFGAIGDGLIGALKNVLPLLVYVASATLAWIALMIVFVIAAGLIVLLANFISPWLALALVIPLYIALLLALFAMMFGVMYYLWRDVCGDDIATNIPPLLAA